MIAFSHYWPYFFLALHAILALAATLHAVMNKTQVQSALGWIALILLSPLLGPILYFIFGINRISRRWQKIRDNSFEKISTFFESRESAYLVPPPPHQIADTLTPFPLVRGNDVALLRGGAEAYPAMLHAIDNARESIYLQSYIFDPGQIGNRFTDALIRAHQRGVAVRVMIDGFGALYSYPSVIRRLRQHGVPAEFFVQKFYGFKLPYFNMRSHRKLLIIDNIHGFTGGLNIRDCFSYDTTHPKCAHDTHFYICGPAAEHLAAAFAQSWHFMTHEKILLAPSYQKAAPLLPAAIPLIHDATIRIIPSEPSPESAANLTIILNALAQAKKRILIHTPYFIPNREMIALLKLAALRGVRVDIIMPRRSNLFFVDLAATAQLDGLTAAGCHVWYTKGPFDHSKLMLIDDDYAYVGSTNMDTRSLRLNFELDAEITHQALVQKIDALLQTALQHGTQVTTDSLRNRPFALRLCARLIWLLSPYL